MITRTVGNVGADYATLQPAVDSIPDNPTDDYTIRIITATDVGGGIQVFLNIPNANNRSFLITVAEPVRFYHGASWPTDMIAASKEGGRLEATGHACLRLNLAPVSPWRVEWLALFMGAGAMGVTFYDETGTVIFRNCLFAATPALRTAGMTDGIYDFEAGQVFGCVFIGFNGFGLYGGGIGASDAFVGNTVIVTHQCYPIATSGDAYANIVMRTAPGTAGVRKDIDAVVGNYNIVSDNNAPGANSLKSQLLANVLVSATDAHLKTKGFLVTPDYQGTYPSMALDIDGEARSVVDPDAGADYIVVVTTPPPTTLPPTTPPPTTLPPGGPSSRHVSPDLVSPRLVPSNLVRGRLVD